MQVFLIPSVVSLNSLMILVQEAPLFSIHWHHDTYSRRISVCVCVCVCVLCVCVCVCVCKGWGVGELSKSHPFLSLLTSPLSGRNPGLKEVVI